MTLKNQNDKDHGQNASETGGVMLYRMVIIQIAILVTFAVARYAVPPIVEEIQYSVTRGRERAEREAATDDFEQDGSLATLSRSYEMIMKRVGPSVVRIDADSTIGSGLIVDSAGIVLTSYHVVEDAPSIDVMVSGYPSVRATTIGIDRHTDLALLRLDDDQFKDLVSVEWGNSDEVNKGALVWAVGSPFGLNWSITSGIVSATDRVFPGRSRINHIQTDARLNPGSSGGPLVDASGRVVGINTAIYGPKFGGISFSIPGNEAKRVFERMQNSKFDQIGYLGISMSEIPVDKKMSVQTVGRAVVLVKEVRSKTPASLAGLQKGDLIYRWNDHVVESPRELRRHVASALVDSVAKIGLLRNGEPLVLQIQVGTRPLQLRQ